MAANNDKKLKLLLFGLVGENIIPFCNKIKSLHKSKAGPFDLCFCVGSFQVPDANVGGDSDEYRALQSLPIPVYLQDALVTTTAIKGEDNEDEIRTVIAPNLKAFPSSKANIYNVSVDAHPQVDLVVASCPRNLRLDDHDGKMVKPLMDKLSHVSYVGCDLLLTTHWPQGMESLLLDGDNEVEQQRQQAKLCATYDVAEIALRARARYHVVTAHSEINHYWQSPPFTHLAATTSTQTPQHTGRVIAIGKVSGDKKKKVPKQHKFVHAVGIVPLHFMDNAELQASLGSGVRPCPYTDESYQKDGESASQFAGSAGLSEAQARRIIAEGAGNGATGRWNLKGNKKRSRNEATHEAGKEEVDPNNTTLFVHGLHSDVSGQLQDSSNPLLLEAFRPYGAIEVRRPPNARTTAFAFLQFETHEAAKLCLETLGGETTVQGTTLQVKWGKATSNNNSHNNNKRQRLTEADAKESSTLYFRLPRSVELEQAQTAAQHVRKWMELTLEDALNEDGSESRITAAEEPALQVELQWTAGHAYGFLKFASHAAASMALATLTGSTDGGLVQENATDTADEKDDSSKTGGDDEKKSDNDKEKQQEDQKVGGDTTKTDKSDDKQQHKKIWGLAMHWALGTNNEMGGDKQRPGDIIQDADCDFQFKRQHFPADSRKDCWFCLASESCEKHLITGVYQQCYAAMAKGAIHRGHVLLIPVAHSSKGAFLDPIVSQEIQQLKTAVRKHAQEVYDYDLFVFERAIQTRGGYHTHIQCIPVPKGLSVKLETTLRAQAKVNNIEFREIQSPDLDIATLLRQDNNVGDDDDDTGGYFYAEVAMSGGKLEYKRFLYKVKPQQQEDNNNNGRGRALVPLQFGREIIAAVMGKSELAHWKACQVNKEEETKMAVEFRQSFEPYYTVE